MRSGESGRTDIGIGGGLKNIMLRVIRLTRKNPSPAYVLTELIYYSGSTMLMSSI